jgi:prepilin-type processing-associated H-X9-DG protein/prepilin-type N-terminal cleavage/methylation domain-containing protein
MAKGRHVPIRYRFVIVRSLLLGMTALSIRTMSRKALSLIEVLVVIAIIALLITIILPAVQMAREAARRHHCASNLRQLGIAFHGYEEEHGMFPPGSSRGFSFHVSILPQIERADLYNSINLSVDYIEPENLTVAATRIELFICPSDPSARIATSDGAVATNYAGNTGSGFAIAGYDGFMGPLRRTGPISAAAIVDGLSNTAAVSECLVSDGSLQALRPVWHTDYKRPFHDFQAVCAVVSPVSATDHDAWLRGRPWTYGDNGATLYNHVVTPNRLSCFNGNDVPEGAYSATSQHSNGVNLLFADGHSAFISNDVDKQIWSVIASRRGDEVGGF